MITESTTNKVEVIDALSHVKVHWEDTLDNWSLANEKIIEAYFKKKYKTDKVKVLFTAIINKKSDIVVEGDADASELVLDENYQKLLIDRYILDNEVTVNMVYLNKLDGTVNTHLEDYKENTSRYKKYRIKNISFSNFLSFGQNNKLVIDGRPGITSVVSSPKNFGGKTTATIDLILFAFYGTTTKTKKNIDIFNKFTKEDKVWVRCEIEMDGECFIIERTLTREMMKSGEYKVTASIEFQKKLAQGGFKNLKGDEKKMTEEYIKSYIGSEADFLITIMSTADTLDDLIKTLPTERGRILTRFIGLEFYREKEKICKRLYDEWKGTSKLHTNSMENLLKNISVYAETISETELMKSSADSNLITKKQFVEDIKLNQNNLLNKRVLVDVELYKVNEGEIVAALNGLDIKIIERETTFNAANADMVKPLKEFDVDRLGILENAVRTNQNEKNRYELEKTTLEATIIRLKNSETCITCHQALVGVDFTDQINDHHFTIKDLVTKISYLISENVVSLDEIETIKATKVYWDNYEKKELTVGKIKLELEMLLASKVRGSEKLKTYIDNKENVESNKIIDTQLVLLKNDLENAEQEKEMLMLKCMGYSKDIDNAKIRIDEHNTLISLMKRDEIIDNVYKTYMEIYGKNGISKMVLGTMIPVINFHLKIFLSDTCDFVLDMRMNDKNEVEFWMVDTDTGIDKPLSSGSGFEKTVSSLALRCVLAKVCSLPKPNIILFDEIFGKVADENLDKLGLFFEKIKEHFEQIWLISHNSYVNDWAEHTIKISKNNGVSELISL